jgi:mannose-6-phosphate isomerase-like protein (cupin superfamily)
MSFQRHFKRNEIWLVSDGSCIVSYSNDTNNKNIHEVQLNKFDHYLVPIGHWHQITNLSNVKTHIIEIQYGEACDENDIERKSII